MGAYPAQAIINIQVNQSLAFRAPPLIPSHCLYQLSFPCRLIITQLRWFVKTLFDFFQKDFFNLYCALTSLCTRQGFVASFISHLGCVALIVSQLGRFVKRFLPLFGLRRRSSHYSSGWSYFIPLSMIVYHRLYQKSTCQSVQIRENIDSIFVHSVY